MLHKAYTTYLLVTAFTQKIFIHEIMAMIVENNTLLAIFTCRYMWSSNICKNFSEQLLIQEAF